MWVNAERMERAGEMMRIVRFMPMKEDRDRNPLWKRVGRLVALFPVQVLYSLFGYVFIFLRSLFTRRRSYRYEVSICAIFQNEGRFLREWVEYHRIIGVDHLYLYNNNSSDDYKAVLAPYVESGFVTLTDWPERFAQLKMYEDCWRRHRDESHWIGFIDLDEFVNLQKDDDIKDFLRRYRRYPGVYLSWREFGTSGRMEEGDGLVTEKYTSCWPCLQFAGKTFINNDYRRFFITVHCFHAYCGRIPMFPVTDSKTFAYRTEIFFPYVPRHPKAWINHYWSKSYEWFKYKTFGRDDVASAALLEGRKKSGIFESHEVRNTTKDHSIQRFLVQLKRGMEESNSTS